MVIWALRAPQDASVTHGSRCVQRGAGGGGEDPRPNVVTLNAGAHKATLRSSDDSPLCRNSLGGSAYTGHVMRHGRAGQASRTFRVQGYLAHKKTPTLLAPPGTLGIGLR